MSKYENTFKKWMESVIGMPVLECLVVQILLAVRLNDNQAVKLAVSFITVNEKSENPQKVHHR